MSKHIILDYINWDKFMQVKEYWITTVIEHLQLQF